MKMHLTPLRPTPEHLAQIECILARLRPDDPGAPFDFIGPEIERRAVDLWIVERFIPKIVSASHKGRYLHPLYDAVLGLIPPLRPGLSVVARA